MLTRWKSFDDVFTFQREVDRLFNEFWSDLPTRSAVGSFPSVQMNSSPTLQVNSTDDGWQVNVPLPGIDPKHVSLEVAGNNLTIRADVPTHEADRNASRYEQTLTIPQFLNLDKLSASHRHGMLRLTLPLKESVKPRRIQIDVPEDDHKQLEGAR
jgi:HSP20 family protein